MPGLFSISKYIFILLSGFHHLQGYASMSRDRGTRSNVWKAGKLLLSRAHAHAQELKAGDWRRDQRAFFPHYNANRHRWPWPEQGIKSVGQHPMGEPWAFPWSQTAVIGRKKLERISRCREFRVCCDKWWKSEKRVELNLVWEIAVCVVNVASNHRRALGFT